MISVSALEPGLTFDDVIAADLIDWRGAVITTVPVASCDTVRATLDADEALLDMVCWVRLLGKDGPLLEYATQLGGALIRAAEAPLDVRASVGRFELFDSRGALLHRGAASLDAANRVAYCNEPTDRIRELAVWMRAFDADDVEIIPMRLTPLGEALFAMRGGPGLVAAIKEAR